MVKYLVWGFSAAGERYITLSSSVKQFSLYCVVAQRGVAWRGEAKCRGAACM